MTKISFSTAYCLVGKKIVSSFHVDMACCHVNENCFCIQVIYWNWIYRPKKIILLLFHYVIQFRVLFFVVQLKRPIICFFSTKNSRHKFQFHAQYPKWFNIMRVNEKKNTKINMKHENVWVWACIWCRN